MTTGRVLTIWRDGRFHQAQQRLQLPPDAQGNLQTLQLMAQIVREDSTQKDLAAFMRRYIIGRGTRSLNEQIEAVFNYCRDEIEYLQEADDTETIMDLWSCMFSADKTGETALGDCAIKSTALTTCFALLDEKRIGFRAIQQIEGANYFNHVYVWREVDGSKQIFDPTLPEFRIGDELNYFAHYDLPIFQ